MSWGHFVDATVLPHFLEYNGWDGNGTTLPKYIAPTQINELKSST